MKDKIDFWKSALRKNKKYSFFSTLEWYSILSKYYKSKFRIIKLNNDALLPVFYKRKGPFKIYYSSFVGTYTGVIRNDSTKEERKLISEYFPFGNYDIVGCPFSSNNTCLSNSTFTQIVDLNKFSIDQLSNNHKRSIKNAHQNELDIEISENLDDWLSYFEIYKEVTVQRGDLASNRYGWFMFQLIYDMQNKELRKLWLIKYRNEIIGGGIFFYFNQVNYWHGVNNNLCKKLCGSHLLHLKVMQSAKDLGYSIYDFSPSSGFDGVERFKEGFNSMKVYFESYHRRTEVFKRILKMYLSAKFK